MKDYDVIVKHSRNYSAGHICCPFLRTSNLHQPVSHVHIAPSLLPVLSTESLVCNCEILVVPDDGISHDVRCRIVSPKIVDICIELVAYIILSDFGWMLLKYNFTFFAFKGKPQPLSISQDFVSQSLTLVLLFCIGNQSASFIPLR